MPDPWANSGLDLHLVLAARAGACGSPRATRCATPSRADGSSRDAVFRLRARSPPTSASRATRSPSAYAQLVAEGWLVARQGSGTRVGAAAGRARQPRRGAAGMPRRAGTTCAPAPRPDAFPALGLADRRPPGAEPTHRGRRSDTATRAGARTARALAGYLGRARGVRAAPSASSSAPVSPRASRMVRAAAGAGRAPAWRRAVTGREPPRTVLAQRAARSPLAVDDEGAARRPASEMSTRCCLRRRTSSRSAPRSSRRAARPGRRLGGAHRRALVEDDYDGEFRYDRQPVGAMQALAPEPRRLRRHREQDAGARAAAGLAGTARSLVEPVIAVKTPADRQTGAWTS